MPPHVWAIVDDASTASREDCDCVKKKKKTFVLCVATKAPPQFVGSAMRSIALNALTLTFVGMKLCNLHDNPLILLYLCSLPLLCHPRLGLLGWRRE